MSGLTSILSRSLPLTCTTMVTVSARIRSGSKVGQRLEVDGRLAGMALLPDLRGDVRGQRRQEGEQGVGGLVPHHCVRTLVAPGVALQQVELLHAVGHRRVVRPALEVVGHRRDGAVGGLAHGAVGVGLGPDRGRVGRPVSVGEKVRQSRSRKRPHPSMT